VVKLVRSKVDYRRRKADGSGRATYLDFHCDGCSKFARSKYDKPSSNWHHKHKVLYTMPKNNRRLWSVTNKYLGEPGPWFGEISEIKGRSPKILAAQKEAALKARKEIESNIADARSGSSEFSRMCLYDYYRWCIRNAAAYEHSCSIQLGSYLDRDRKDEHPGYEEDENLPIWCPTGWESPGSYFNSFTEEAMYETNWEGVKEEMLEIGPCVDICSSEVKILLPRVTINAFANDKYHNNEWLTDEMNEAALDGDEPKWVVALRKAWEFHKEYMNYPLLFEDAASQKELELINESFDEYSKNEVIAAMKKVAPQFFVVDSEKAEASLREKADSEQRGFEYDEPGGGSDWWGEIDEVELLDMLVLPKDRELWPAEVYERSCFYHGELYCSEEDVERELKQEIWSNDNWIPATEEEKARNSNAFGHAAPFPDYIKPVQILRAWDRGVAAVDLVAAGQQVMDLEEAK
jgi:hypothetical protein